MDNIFVVYDQYGNIILASDTYPNVKAGTSILVLAGNDPNGLAALANKNAYMVQNGQLIPATTLQINRVRSFVAPWETFDVTISSNDGQQHTVTMTILGVTKTINTGDTVQIVVHQAINNDLEAVFTGQGVVTQHTSLQTGGGNMQLQTYTDSNGLLHVAPVQKNDLIAFYTSVIPQELSTADLTTSDSMLMQTVFGIILPTLTSGSTPLVQLDANQQNAVKDIQANVLPNIVTTLENAAPVPAAGQPQTYDLHYNSYRTDLAIAKQAFDQYVTDVQSIPNLV